jgi:hypothetical protein
VSLTKFGERLEKLGCTVAVNGATLELDIDDFEIKIDFDDELLKSIRGFYRARQYQFNADRRMLSGNKFVEFQVTKLDPGFTFKPYHLFTDAKENKVILSPASNEYLLSYFESDVYEETFHFIKSRIERRFSRRQPKRGRRANFRADDLFLNHNTITYHPKRKIDREKLIEVGLEKIRACLFNLTYSKNESWEVRDDIKSNGFRYRLVDEETELDIPSANYDPLIVSHYKVAKSSIFPGQVYLSYYHILEHFFLRVADEELFQAARSQLNEPEFKATYENVTKLLASVKKNDNTGDEKKMLRAVLFKYVPEEDYIEFVNELESSIESKIITEKNLKVFGDTFSIKMEKGHALSNTASLLKHIRNSIVHSSDRYTREDCYQPFSESEEVVSRYIPIIQFMAEKVIFSTAE